MTENDNLQAGVVALNTSMQLWTDNVNKTDELVLASAKKFRKFLAGKEPDQNGV